MTVCRSCELPEDQCQCRRCIVCTRRKLVDAEPQTCWECAARIKQLLEDIHGLWLHLPEEALAHPVGEIPGGSALVILGPGSRGRYDALLGDEATDADPPALAYELGQWEDVWRQDHGHPAARLPMSVSAAVGYLAGNLSWAAQWHPAFDEFAADLRRLRSAMASVMQVGRRNQRSEATCLDCGAAALEQEFAPPRPCRHGRGEHVEWCDQGGRREDLWICSACGSKYDSERIALAAGETITEERRHESHGTRASYVRHRRRDEDPCEPCRWANREYLRAWRASRVA